MLSSLKRLHLKAKGLIQIGNSLNFLSAQLKILFKQKDSGDFHETKLKSTLLFLTSYQNMKVVDRIDEFDWPLTTKLLVPNIGGLKWITLGYALLQNSLLINQLAEEMHLQTEVQEIISKGALYKKNGVSFPSDSSGLLSRNEEKIRIFAGKTLLEVGSLNDLEDKDVGLLTLSNSIKNISIIIKGKQYDFPFSEDFPMDKLNDPDYLLECKFRLSYAHAKSEDGVTPKFDENGEIVFDEENTDISLGKPG